MADGASKPQQVSEFIQQSAVEPVQDEGQKMMEAMAQSVTGQVPTPKDPQEEARKKQEEALKKRNIHQFLNQFNQEEQHLKQQRIEEQQKKQAQAQEEQQKKQVKQFEVVEKQKKEEDVNQANLKRQEIKGGVGG